MSNYSTEAFAAEEAAAVNVDLELCEAAGVCARLLPDVFQLGEDDILDVVPPETPTAEETRKIDIAVRRCPKQALYYEGE